jgi:predicted metal-dependent enzyme (double-stranded beta helix superfamily)
MCVKERLLDAARENASDDRQNLKLVQDKSKLDDMSQAIPPDLIQKPGLLKLVTEYCRFATKPKLNGADAERMAKIYELAEYDDELDNWIARIDKNIEPFVLALIQQEKEVLSLEDFIHEIKNISSQEMTLQKFKELAQKVYLSDHLVRQHIHFQDYDYCRQVICQTSFGVVFVVSWKPKQSSSIHFHETDLSVIHVYNGTLTHELYGMEKEIISHQGKEGWRPKYILREKQQVEENKWVYIDTNQIHRLINNSTENLVTLHFRLFGQPTDNEDDRPPSSIGDASSNPLDLLCE